MGHLVLEAVLPYKPGDVFWHPPQGSGAGQVQTTLPAWHEPGREYRGHWRGCRAQRGAEQCPQLSGELQVMCRLLPTAASRTGGCVHQQPSSPSEIILQQCGEPVSSTFQLLQGKLNIMVLLMFIIPVSVFFHFWLSDNFLSTSLYFWLVYSHLHQFMDAKACTLCLNSI